MEGRKKGKGGIKRRKQSKQGGAVDKEDQQASQK